jgi:hypothetical protein
MYANLLYMRFFEEENIQRHGKLAENTERCNFLCGLIRLAYRSNKTSDGRVR